MAVYRFMCGRRHNHVCALLPRWEEVACEAGRRWGFSEPSASPGAQYRAESGARPHLRQPKADTSSHKGRRMQLTAAATLLLWVPHSDACGRANGLNAVVAQLSSRSGGAAVALASARERWRGHELICGFYRMKSDPRSTPSRPFGSVDGRLVEPPLHIVADPANPTAADLATHCLTHNFNIPPL